MVPRVAARGRSFKGAGLYYLHDKQAQTSERVAFTHTENLPTNDPEKALRFMAYVAMHADELKRQAGAKASGRKASAPVFGMSLSWHPEQQPERSHMIETGRSALAALGFQEHQTVMVAHQDEAYRHLHLIVNTIHPQTGRAHTPTYSKLALSQWAQAYEQAYGPIYCENRLANNERRRNEEYVKYKDKEIEQKALITKLYREAKDAQAFKQAVEKAGYQLAQGRKLLLIDRDGKAHSLARQIDGVKEKDVREHLRELQLQQMTAAKEQQEKARQEQERRTRAEEEERARQEQQRKRSQGQVTEPLNTAARQPDQAASKQTLAERQAQKPDRYFGPPLPTTVVRLEDRQREELAKFRDDNQQIKERWQGQVRRQYSEKGTWLQKEIAAQEKELEGLNKAQRLLLAARGELKQKEERLASMRLEMADIENFKGTLRGRDEYEARNHAQGLPSLQARHEQERIQLWEDPKAMLRQATGGVFNARSAPPLRAPEPEKPLVELPTSLQDKINPRAEQASPKPAPQQRETPELQGNPVKETPPRSNNQVKTNDWQPDLRENEAVNDNDGQPTSYMEHLIQSQIREYNATNRTGNEALAFELRPQEVDPEKIATVHLLEHKTEDAKPESVTTSQQREPETQALDRTKQELPEHGGQAQADAAHDFQQAEPDAELYALLDGWNAPHGQQPERGRETSLQDAAAQPRSTENAQDAELHALLDGWNEPQQLQPEREQESQGQHEPQDRQPEAEQEAQDQSETSQAESVQSEEDTELYTLLDYWNGYYEQQQQEQAKAAEAEASQASSTQSSADAELYAMLDQWREAEEQEFELGMSLGPE